MASEELAKKLQRRLMLQVSMSEDGNNVLERLGKKPVDKPATCSADTELSAKLTRRLGINEGMTEPKQTKMFNPYTEFKEFTRKQIKDMEQMFKQFRLVCDLQLHRVIEQQWRTPTAIFDQADPVVPPGQWTFTASYDSGKDGFIDLMELKLMMEKLGAPQTHLGLKNMIKEVDEDFDGKLNFREFLLIFHKAAAGELEEDSGLMALARLSEIDVSTEGVQGAKQFFEAKVQALTSDSKFEAEIKAEQQQRKRLEEDRKQRRAAFKELKAAFQ